ncbi:hypothetical protein Pfo_007967 [Paulownia fortunei]|nr:hypothetical protein Pfo_007967 [Paulownia fortunei]
MIIICTKNFSYTNLNLKNLKRILITMVPNQDIFPFWSDPHTIYVSSNESLSSLKEISSTWRKSSLLSDLIKACVSWEYGNSSYLHAKVAACLFAVNVMVKLRSGDMSSLFVSLIERMFCCHKSGGQELENLILSNLFYHIQGELDRCQIDTRPLNEMLQF